MTSSTRFVLYLVVVAAAGAASALTHVVSWAWLSSAVSVLGVVAAYLETPPAARRRLASLTADLGRRSGPALLCLAVGASLLAGGASISACKGSVLPELTQIEQTVLSDLAAGKTLAQVEQDVGEIVAGQAGADVAIIVNDALTFLVDTGVIPHGLIPTARHMLGEVHPVAVAHERARAAALSDGGAP